MGLSQMAIIANRPMLRLMARTCLTIGGIAFSTPFADKPQAGRTSEQS